MIEKEQSYIIFGWRGGKVLAGIVFGMIAVFFWYNAPILIGLFSAAVAATFLYSAYRRFPILRFDEEALEAKTLLGRKRWEWATTSPFFLDPPATALVARYHLVAMYAGNLAEYQSLSGRSIPDHVDADISIDLDPYTAIKSGKSAQALLDRVNEQRAKALLVSAPDLTNSSSYNNGGDIWLRRSLRNRRMRFYLLICASVILSAAPLAIEYYSELF